MCASIVVLTGMEPAMDDDYEVPRERNLWRCQSCGHGFIKPWPMDRVKFYASQKAAKCPKCKSEDAVPEGY